MRLIVTQSRPKRREKEPRQVLGVEVVVDEGRRLGWIAVGVVERGELSCYDFCLLVQARFNRLRRQRTDDRPLRRHWQAGRCVIEVQDWVTT